VPAATLTLDQLPAWLESRARRLESGDRRRLLGQLRDVLKADALEGFQTSSDPDRVAWRPLKRRRGRPLVKTGRLRGSISAVIQGDAVSVFSGVPYSRFHQFGTASIPARVHIGIGSRVWPEVERLALDHVESTLDAN
jgi:phage gpG-like protein